MGFLKFGVLGLIAGSLVSSLVGLRTLLKIAVHDFQQQASQVNWRSLVRTAKLYYRFPLLNTWGQLLTSVSTQLPIFVLTSGFGATYTGYFSLCQRILLLPTLLISGAIAPVFFSRAKQAKQDGSLTALTERMLYSIAGINAVFVMFVAFFGESLFEVVFGDKWSRAGVYATALAPWLLLNFLVTPLATLPLVFERQATDLIFHISLLLVRALSLGVGIYFGSDLLAMMLFGWCSAAFMLIYMNWLVSLVKIPLSPLLLRVGREILIASVLLGACRFVLWWSNNNFLLTGFVLIPVFAFFIKRTLEQVKGI
jgi:O-antigen/teichoic acid export membrane protein